MATSACPGDTTPPSTPTNLAPKRLDGDVGRPSPGPRRPTTSASPATALYKNGTPVGTTDRHELRPSRASPAAPATPLGVDAVRRSRQPLRPNGTTLSADGLPAGHDAAVDADRPRHERGRPDLDHAVLDGLERQRGRDRLSALPGRQPGGDIALDQLRLQRAHVRDVRTRSASPPSMPRGTSPAPRRSPQRRRPARRHPPGSCTTTISSGLAVRDPERRGRRDDLPELRAAMATSITNLSKSSDVTIQPAPGASATIGSCQPPELSHLHFTGGNGSLTVGGSTLDSTNTLPNCSDHITFDYLRFTRVSDIFPRCAAMAILVDHANLDNLFHPAGGRGTRSTSRRSTRDQRPTRASRSPTAPSTALRQRVAAPRASRSSATLTARRSSTTSSPSCQIRDCDRSTASTSAGSSFTAAPRALKGNYFHDNGIRPAGLRCGDGAHHGHRDNVWVCTCIYPWSIQAVRNPQLDLPAQHLRRWRRAYFQYQ